MPKSAMTTIWRALGIGLTVLLVACGALTAITFAACQSEEHDQVYHAAVARVVIDKDVADVTIGPGESGVVTVRRKLVWSLTRPKTPESWDGNTLRIRPDCGLAFVGDVCRVRYEVLVPPQTEIVVTTLYGDISVRDLAGDLRLSSDGRVALSNTTGSVNARTSAGYIHATGLGSADVEASTGSGEIVMSYSKPPRRVAASSSSGNITLTLPRGDGYSVSAESDDGDTNIGVSREADAGRSITASTGAGNVIIGYA